MFSLPWQHTKYLFIYSTHVSGVTEMNERRESRITGYIPKTVFPSLLRELVATITEETGVPMKSGNFRKMYKNIGRRQYLQKLRSKRETIFTEVGVPTN